MNSTSQNFSYPVRKPLLGFLDTANKIPILKSSYVNMTVIQKNKGLIYII